MLRLAESRIRPLTRDFEVHPRGTAKEIELSRDLVNAIDDMVDHSGLSVEAVKAFGKLFDFHRQMIEAEQQ